MIDKKNMPSESPDSGPESTTTPESPEPPSSPASGSYQHSEECELCANPWEDGSPGNPADKDKHIAISLNSCEHILCWPCLRGYLETQYQNKQQPACPFTECQAFLHHNDIKEAVGDEMANTFLTWASEAAFTEKRVYCLNKNCNGFVLAKDLIGVDKTKPVTCPYCKIESCLSCQKTHYHVGKSCAEYQKSLTPAEKLKDEQVKQTLALVSSWEKEGSVSTCPCGEKVIRNQGCNVIKCLACMQEFCFYCRTPWEQHKKEGARHFLCPSCPLCNRIATRPEGSTHIKERVCNNPEHDPYTFCADCRASPWKSCGCTRYTEI